MFWLSNAAFQMGLLLGGGGFPRPPPPQANIRMADNHRRTPPPPHPTPGPPQIKVTIVGNNKIYDGENPTGPFLVHNILVPDPCFPPLLLMLA